MTITIANRVHVRKGEYIGRPSPLGNPFRIGRDGSRKEVITRYREWLLNEIPKNEEVTLELNRLWTIAQTQDLVLLCWCKPQACHGDVIKEILESDY